MIKVATEKKACEQSTREVIITKILHAQVPNIREATDKSNDFKHMQFSHLHPHQQLMTVLNKSQSH